MSKRRFLLIGLPVVGLAVVVSLAAVWYARPKPTTVTIEVSGTAGLPIEGTCEEDGKSRDLKGVVPARFVLEGSRVTFSLTTPADAGEFRAKAGIDNQVFGSLGSGSPPKNGVRGWVKTSWAWSSTAHWIESFAKDEHKGWLTPPP